MTVRQPRYSKEEFARRGNEIYQSQVRPQVEEGNQGRIVAIDIETGAFEVADDLDFWAFSKERAVQIHLKPLQFLYGKKSIYQRSIWTYISS
jgi:hypothetical protein